MAAPLAKSWNNSETSGASPRPETRAAASAPAAQPAPVAGHTVKDLQCMLSSAFADARGAEQKWSIGNAIAFGLACSLFLWSMAAFAAVEFL